MPWSLLAQRSRPDTVEGRVFQGIRQLIRTKGSMPSMHACGSVSWFWTGHPSVLGFVRRHPLHGAVMVLANVAEQPAVLDPGLPSQHGFVQPDDRLAPGTLFSGTVLASSSQAIQMAGLSVRWISDRALEAIAPLPCDS
jgi:hypothetical protein